MAITATAQNKDVSRQNASTTFIATALSDIQRPAAFVMTNNGDVNLREQPSTTARKICSISRNIIYGVIEERNGWYKVKCYDWDENTWTRVVRTGWVSGKVTHKTVNKPITASMQNETYGYVDYQDPDAMEDQTYYNRVYIRPDGVCIAWTGDLYVDGVLHLGRYIDNVCCFKYMIIVNAQLYNAEMGVGNDYVSLVKNGDKRKGLWVQGFSMDGDECWDIIYGSNYATRDGDLLDMKVFDDDALLEKIFSKTIKARKTSYYYIASALLSGKYMSNH